MPDNDRLDLSMDVDKIGDDLLKDVKAATEQVKKRRDTDKAQEAKSAEKAKTRQLSAIVIAAAAVVLVLIAYFVIFAKPDAPAGSPTGPYTQTQTPTPAIKPPGAPTAVPSTTPPARPMPSTGRGSQTNHPSDDYEQPSDGGM
ncbi:MAG: hypothetical protein ACYC64_14590 [Armatimonadota bacterium]